MDHNIAETLQMLIGFAGFTIISTTGLKVWLKKKELDRHVDSGLEEAVENVRLEMDDLRAEHAQQISDLQERVDFAERLLSKGRGG